MNFSPKTKVVQLWHGVGAFKRFGLSTEDRPEIRRITSAGTARLTHLFVSAERVIPFYAEAFAVSTDKIFATGLPVSDFYFDRTAQKEAQSRFYSRFPHLQGKKLILYAPTFRRTAEESQNVIKHFSPLQLHDRLGDDYVFLVRFHPRFIDPMRRYLDDSCIDVSEYDNVKDLYCAADVLVTDYSSVLVEYSALMKPSVLFPYDLEEFDRGFYLDYVSSVPGPIVRTSDELAEAIRVAATDPAAADKEKIKAFLDLNFDYYDSGSTKRVLDVLNY